MRKQYHLRVVGEETQIWDVHKLIRKSRRLPVQEVSIEEISEIDENWWYQEPGQAPTPRSITKHLNTIEKTELKYPIILCADGRLMDGMHRIVKALAEGRRTIPAVRFQITPPCDFKNISLDDLPYPDEEL